MRLSQDASGEMKQQVFADRLVRWFRANQRDLPWRRTKDPYHIWVSEIMLQQTRVDTVIPYYERFLDRFPTVDDLAQAPEADLLKVWEGLGYYSRVRNMQVAARMICDQHDGIMPNTREEISKLKGIGPYTAGAVLSIAYGLPEPAVDGNVLRVISRYFLLYDDIAKAATRTKVEDIVEGLIPHDAAADFNQALMELGALICTPRNARCEACPVSGHCSAYAAGMVDELPIKTKAKKPREEERATFIIEGTGEREGMIMLQRRPDEGLLARMWELPNELMSFDAQAQFGLDDRFLMEAEHIFSHIRWRMKVYSTTEDEAEEVLGIPVNRDARYESLQAQAGADESARVAETAAGYAANIEGAENVDVGDLSQVDRKDAVTMSSTEVSGKEAVTVNSTVIDRKDSVGARSPQTDPVNAAAGDILWVSKDTWREVALPNVFLRILKSYFSS